MHRLTQLIMRWVAPLAALGGFGIALIALLDSSFLSLPEATDVYVVTMTTAHPDRWFYYGAMATIGSVAGCLILYYLGRKGGEAFLRKRFHERHIDRAFAAFRRYGLLTVAVPSILPPPTPFKIFVILAGAADVTPGTFALSVTGGRAFRYLSEALLAKWYGEAAMQFIHQNLARVSIGLAALVLLIGVATLYWRRRAV